MSIQRLQTAPGDVLVVIDPQVDFCPGGALAVAGGDEIMPLINQIAARFEHVVITQDWHPRDQISFASNHPGAAPFSVIEVAYGPQTLWPDHCVQGSPGAQLHPALDTPHAELILRKGYNRAVDSYSAFFENDKTTATGLSGYLRQRGFKRCVFVGLALDFCVRYSAEDAIAEGFEAVVIPQASRAIDLDGSAAAAMASFAALGVALAAP
ncbi:bifunctional nicotinamidase/pyrazinamidase [Phenylobacterium sp. NIBR 498073]|uniref:bifunctional nicotinamidase/pyrazinamidase n=1 Tax=Phenylobacterium sp. NIBR 498073 TaxID=3015177 RepID=UPI0022B33A47|nr:bifunctional nicotinamidase/pyrazinamidase [Phenylobacterium sp. NIBR 498073]WGU38207.1 bifunctional nicotinamidase/pyrazinamidase [Phenylobacterium sp. NIBR 498073]